MMIIKRNGVAIVGLNPKEIKRNNDTLKVINAELYGDSLDLEWAQMKNEVVSILSDEFEAKGLIKLVDCLQGGGYVNLIFQIIED